MCVTTSVCMLLSQPSSKPVVLDKQVLMFGLHHMGCIVTVCILVGCFCNSLDVNKLPNQTGHFRCTPQANALRQMFWQIWK